MREAGRRGQSTGYGLGGKETQSSPNPQISSIKKKKERKRKKEKEEFMKNLAFGCKNICYPFSSSK